MEMMFTIIGVFAFLLGLSFIVGAIVLCLKKWLRIKKSVKTTGVVVNNETSLGMAQHGATPRSTLYKPTVRFQTTDGRTVDYTPKVSTSYNNYSVGENVPVYYNPQQPSEAIVGTTFHLWFIFLLFGFVGGVFAFVGAMFIAINHSRLIFDMILR
jgi:hypothetical protein